MVLLVVSDLIAASREKRLLFVGSEDRHPFNGLCFQDNLGKPAPDSSSLNQSVFNLARGDGVAVASAGPYANHLRLTPDR